MVFVVTTTVEVSECDLLDRIQEVYNEVEVSETSERTYTIIIPEDEIGDEDECDVLDRLEYISESLAEECWGE